jgi:hypothetical protein
MNILLTLIFLIVPSKLSFAETRPEQQLQKLGIKLYKPFPSVPGRWTNVKSEQLANHQSRLTVAGTPSEDDKGNPITVKKVQKRDGKSSLCVGQTPSLEEGQAAARWAAISLLSTLNEELEGDLSRVTNIVSIDGYVHPESELNPSEVMDGASKLLAEIFGNEIGTSARMALAAAPPECFFVEIKAVVDVRDKNIVQPASSLNSEGKASAIQAK